jgi:ComF family protein
MHFYLPRFKELANSVVYRLKIGSYCVLCNRSTHQNLDICSACEKWLVPRILQIDNTSRSYLCVLCGMEQMHVSHAKGSNSALKMNNSAGNFYCCHFCQNIDGVFHRMIAPYRYEFPLDQIIARMKYGQRRVFARVLGGLLASAAKSSESLPDVLIPVPLHASRQLVRGYNQAADIGQWCARELNLQYKPWLVSRVFDTGSLAGLSKAARQLRILGAFKASPDVKGCRIAIVDDVMTTGATARELARELYDTGALSVELWVLARTSSDR